MEQKLFKNYKKRSISIGIPFICVMVIALTMSLTSNAISGCAGDCMTCHPTLENSKDHQALKTCAKCHNNSKIKLKISSNTDGCGDRCFMCHSQWPKDGAHASLDTCLECHEK